MVHEAGSICFCSGVQLLSIRFAVQGVCVGLVRFGVSFGTWATLVVRNLRLFLRLAKWGIIRINSDDGLLAV